MKSLLVIFFVFGTLMTYAQTNSYPSSGNVKVFAVDAGWAEGIAVVKPVGWSGIRLTRNDPAGGNYNGNWALGYNVATGNDFSISTNNGGIQYDGLFHISNTNRNVGIGTTAPSTKLHVLDGVPASVQALNSLTKFGIDAAGGGFSEFRTTADNNTYSGLLFSDNNLGGYVTFRNYPDDKLHLGAYAGITFDVGTDNNVGGKAERMRIDGSGNVGIGTSTPDAKLAVKGQIHAQEVKVDLIGAVAPDYVFASNYQLPTLDYIKTYIDQNKHLPEVPSGKEMETNGVNLGEMNMILLKKIEELTLYVIELKKENVEMKDEIKNLKNRK